MCKRLEFDDGIDNLSPDLGEESKKAKKKKANAEHNLAFSAFWLLFCRFVCFSFLM